MKVETKEAEIFVSRDVDNHSWYKGLLVYSENGKETFEIIIGKTALTVDLQPVIDVIRKGREI